MNTSKNKVILAGFMSLVFVLVFCGRVLGIVNIKEQKLLASNGTASSSFGRSVAISGDMAIVGAYYDNGKSERSGSAYIFHYNGTNWVEKQKLLASDGNKVNWFGYSVAISGDKAIVGAVFDDSKGVFTGSAYIFHYNGTNWVEKQKLLASDGKEMSYFGWSVAISGDRAIVSAVGSDGKGVNTGSAYIFHYNGTNWVQKQKLLASDGQTEDNFGYSVAISGDKAIVGACEDDGKGERSGSAYIFHYNGTNWVEKQKLLASDEKEMSYFGWSVAISGNKAIVGAYHDNEKGECSGAAYIFNYSGTKWLQEQKLSASDGQPRDLFGHSVAISGDKAIVGAVSDDDKGENSGSVYIFNYNGTNWVENQKLLSSNGKARDDFGCSVAISGDKVIVGATGDDSKANDSGAMYSYDLGAEFSTPPKIGDAYALQSKNPDNILEIAIGTQNGKIYLFDNLGNVLPGWPQQVGVNASIIGSPAMVDIDGDSLDEIVACTKDAIYALKGDGSLVHGFPQKINKPLAYISSCPIIGDLDGDSLPDILVQVTDNDGKHIYPLWSWNINDGLSVFMEPKESNYIISSPPSIGDIDGNGRLEIVYVDSIYNGGAMCLRICDYMGKELWSKSFNAYAISDPVLVDMDNDGKLEVVFGESRIEAVKGNVPSKEKIIIHAFRYDGVNELNNWPKEVASVESPLLGSTSVFAGDIDGDAYKEVLIDLYTADSSKPEDAVSKLIALNHDGTIMSGSWPKTLGKGTIGDNIPSLPVIANIDGNAQSEVISLISDKKVSAMDSLGNVLASWPKDIAGAINSLSSSLDSISGNTPAVADLDGNGKMDIVKAGKDGLLYILSADGNYKDKKLEWAQHRRDACNTNCYPQDPGSVNQKPAFVSTITYKELLEKESLYFNVEATDANNDFITITSSAIPSGAYFRNKGFLTKQNPGYSLARFSWIPAYGQAGDYSIVFTATDTKGLSINMNTIITVKPAPNAGIIRIAAHRLDPVGSFSYSMDGVTVKIKELNKTGLTQGGIFDFKDVPAGSYTVSASIKDYEVMPPDNVKVNVTKGSSTTVVFNFKRVVNGNSYVEGYIKDKATKKPLKGIGVYPTNLDVKTTTDSSGYFKIKLPDGACTLKTSSFGYKSAAVSVVVQKDKTVKVPDILLEKDFAATNAGVSSNNWKNTYSPAYSYK